MLFSAVNVCAESSFNINFMLDMKSKGNIFFEGETAQAEAKIFNNDNISHNIVIELDAIGRKYGKTWEKTYNEELLPGSMKTISFSIDFAKEIQKYDIYDMTVTLSEGDLSKTFSYQFSYARYGKRNEHFGINTHFESNDYANTIDHAISVMNKSGISMVRNSIGWSLYEKTEGVYEFPTAFKNVPAKLKKANIDLLYPLLYNNKLYTEGSVKEIPVGKTETDAFIAYMKDVMEKLGNKCQYYELWNESNSNSEHSGYIYADFIKEVYPAFKEANEDATLVGVSLNGNPRYSGNYLKEVLENGGAGNMDAVSWHPYSTMGTLQAPKGTDKPETFLYEWFDVFKGLYAGVDLGDIWTTEQGWNVYFGNTEDEVAANLVRSFAIEMGIGVEKYFWYDLIDDSITYPLGFDAPTLKERIEGRWGVLEGINEKTPMAAKPSFLAICTMNALIGDKEYSANNITDGVYNYEFKGTHNDVVNVIWTENTPIEAQFDFGAECMIKTDMYGNDEYIYSDNGIYTLTASPEPAYYRNGVMPKFDYEYDVETGLCTISGYIDSLEEGKMLNFMVYKPNKGYYDVMADGGKSISYFDQIITGNHGNFRYTFEPSGGEGYCIINLVAEDGEEMEYLLRLIDGMDCRIDFVNTEFDEIKPGDAVVCSVSVNSNEPVTKNYDVYLAFFDGDRLTGIYKQSDSLNDSVSESTDFLVTAPDSFDSLKAFAWENTMTPVACLYEIK